MAIAFVNSTAMTYGTAASTWSIPTHTSIAGGAAFVVGLGPASSAVTVSTVTDNTTNVYKLAVRRDSPKPAASAELWYVANISSLSTRISVTLSGTSSGAMAVGQFTGVSTANALGVTGSSAVTANSSVHSASEITPTAANSLVVMFSRVTASTLAPTAFDDSFLPWTSTGFFGRTVGLYKIQGAASTATGQWRSGAGASTGLVMHSAVIAAFGDTVTPPVGGGMGCCNFTLCGVQ